MRIFLASVITLVGAVHVFGVSPAAAQHIHTRDPVRVEVHGTLSGWGGIGAGARAEFVVAPEGVLPDFDDDISLTAGGELLFFDFNDNHDDHSAGIGIWPGLAAQWNFYFGERWSVFPELGLWLYFGDRNYHDHKHDHDHDREFGWSLMAGIGVRYHMASRNALLLRIQFPGLLQIGVTF